MSLDDRVEQVRQTLRVLVGKKGYVQPGTLSRRLAKEPGLTSISVRQALATLAREGWLEGVSEDGIPYARVRVAEVQPTVEPPSLTAWRRAMTAAGLSISDALTLEPLHAYLDEFAYEDMARIATGLDSVRSSMAQNAGVPSFVVSARELLSSSKLLPSLPPRTLKKFGIDMAQLPDSPPYVVVAGPPTPDAVVFIENPHAFETAVKAGCAETNALIVTFGYGLNFLGEGFGRQLVDLCDMTSELIPLIRAGNPPSLESLFSHGKLLFWGDLDPAGLHIYSRLRQRLPTLRLSAAYRAMLDILATQGGHPYNAATGKTGQSEQTMASIQGDASPLFLACRERGVDQEAVPVSFLHAELGEAF